MSTQHTWGQPSHTVQEYVVDEKLAEKFPGRFVGSSDVWTKTCTNCGLEIGSPSGDFTRSDVIFPDCESYEAAKT
jgi:hypothetical protein